MRALLALIVLLGAGPDPWSTLKCGDEEVRIYRDSWGIPHVFAKTTHAVFFAQGYAEGEYVRVASPWWMRSPQFVVASVVHTLGSE